MRKVIIKKTLEQFTGVYKLSKTLRFELKPIAETKETFNKAGFLDRDRKRAQDYTRVKEILDEQHKYLLERSLSHAKDTISSLDNKLLKQVQGVLNALSTDFDWELLGKALQQYRTGEKDKNAKDELEKVQKNFRKALLVLIQQDEWFESLVKESTPSKYIKGMIAIAKKRGITPDESVESFSRFACYFKGYQENRKNIYSAEAQKTAAPNRVVNDNFPRFLEAARIFGVIQTKYPGIVRDVEEELAELLEGKRLADIFTLSSYSNFLSQTGIDRLNTIIGGNTQESRKKIRGVNEFINLYRQQHEDARADRQLTTNEGVKGQPIDLLCIDTYWSFCQSKDTQFNVFAKLIARYPDMAIVVMHHLNENGKPYGRKDKTFSCGARVYLSRKEMMPGQTLADPIDIGLDLRSNAIPELTKSFTCKLEKGEWHVCAPEHTPAEMARIIYQANKLSGITKEETAKLLGMGDTKFTELLKEK